MLIHRLWLTVYMAKEQVVMLDHRQIQAFPADNLNVYLLIEEEIGFAQKYLFRTTMPAAFWFTWQEYFCRESTTSNALQHPLP
jgi:hypothetical protein